MGNKWQLSEEDILKNAIRRIWLMVGGAGTITAWIAYEISQLPPYQQQLITEAIKKFLAK